MSENEVLKQQVAGFYRDIDLQYTSKEDKVLNKEREIEGVKKVGEDDEYTLLEIHVDLNIEGIDEDNGIKVPYIVTIDEGSSQVLSISIAIRLNFVSSFFALSLNHVPLIINLLFL